MALAQLIEKLKSKKQDAHRSVFAEYLSMVRSLASGGEIDAGECSSVLDAADRTETDLERDVTLQTQRLAWHAQRLQNAQARQDARQAENDLQNAQAALREAHARLTPAIDAAYQRKIDAEHRSLITMQAESWLSDPANLVDKELLQIEASLNRQLAEINAELRPLQQDVQSKQHSLGNASLRLEQLRRHEGAGHDLFGTLNAFFNAGSDLKATRQRVDDLQSEVTQLESMIGPRLREQSRLQTELASIYEAKLLP